MFWQTLFHCDLCFIVTLFSWQTSLFLFTLHLCSLDRPLFHIPCSSFRRTSLFSLDRPLFFLHLFSLHLCFIALSCFTALYFINSCLQFFVYVIFVFTAPLFHVPCSHAPCSHCTCFIAPCSSHFVSLHVAYVSFNLFLPSLACHTFVLTPCFIALCSLYIYCSLYTCLPTDFVLIVTFRKPLGPLFHCTCSLTALVFIHLFLHCTSCLFRPVLQTLFSHCTLTLTALLFFTVTFVLFTAPWFQVTLFFTLCFSGDLFFVLLGPWPSCFFVFLVLSWHLFVLSYCTTLFIH
jgi:hypothetical protein